MYVTGSNLLTVSLAISVLVSGCAPPSPEQSEATRNVVWHERVSILTRTGVKATLEQEGSRVVAKVSNGGEQPVCISKASWPTGALMLDHFRVTNGGVVVPYSGPLASVLSSETLRLDPGETWTLQSDLMGYYSTDWRTAQVSDFWAPFYPCEP